jgi:predicted AlkP superfamily pyrophosphatase or phosphodiesterase
MKPTLLALLMSFLSSVALAQSARDPIPLDSIAKPGSPGEGRLGRAAKPRALPAEGQTRLVVVLVADMFRADYLARYAADFGAGGFKRLLGSGAVWLGKYGQQNTYTAVGHAQIVSGAYPYVNGIMQNKFFNWQRKQVESMLYDPAAKLLGSETSPEDETSPRNLVGSTVGDELMLASPGSKVVAAAIKDRGAILLGGHLGKAYFMNDATGEMSSSTYYGDSLPAWVQAFNARKLAAAVLGKTWERLLPADRYSEADDYRLEFDGKGLGRVFPHKLTAKGNPLGADYYSAFSHTPYAVDYTFAFANAALDGEQLGKRGVTDMLEISITPTDIAGHAFGPFSQELHDMVARLDRNIAAFLSDLDRRFKAGEVLVVFTADHGAVPIPEWSDEHKLAGVRIKKATIKKQVESALSARYGAGSWVIALEDPSVYLNRDLIAQKKVDPAEVERVAGEAILGLPGFLAYYTRTQLQNGWIPPTRVAQTVARAFSTARSGDVITVTAPFSFWGKYAEKDWGTTHGSPFRYDTDVPLILMGKAFRPGYYGETNMVDLAATLSEIMRISRPSGCEGESLGAAMR